MIEIPPPANHGVKQLQLRSVFVEKARPAFDPTKAWGKHDGSEPASNGGVAHGLTMRVLPTRPSDAPGPSPTRSPTEMYS